MPFISQFTATCRRSQILPLGRFWLDLILLMKNLPQCRATLYLLICFIGWFFEESASSFIVIDAQSRYLPQNNRVVPFLRTCARSKHNKTRHLSTWYGNFSVLVRVSYNQTRKQSSEYYFLSTVLSIDNFFRNTFYSMFFSQHNSGSLKVPFVTYHTSS